jgi:sugar diacid utilization regulator
MNIERLLPLFPEGMLNPAEPEKLNLNDYYVVESLADRFFIPRERLNQREMDLLAVFFEEEAPDFQSNNPWKKLLFDSHVNTSISPERIQLIYLNNPSLNHEDFQIWRETMMASLYVVLDVLYLENDLFVVILDYDKLEKKMMASLIEVIHSLNQDFSVLTQGMIGQIVPVNERSSSIYRFEQKLFQQMMSERKVEGVQKLSHFLMYELSREFKANEIELPALFNYLTNKNELEELIRSLYASGGNLSKTADDLYIHRNTLTYRINQFQKQTGFDLTDFSDLLICYLAI